MLDEPLCNLRSRFLTGVQDWESEMLRRSAARAKLQITKTRQRSSLTASPMLLGTRSMTGDAMETPRDRAPDSRREGRAGAGAASLQHARGDHRRPTGCLCAAGFIGSPKRRGRCSVWNCQARRAPVLRMGGSSRCAFRGFESPPDQAAHAAGLDQRPCVPGSAARASGARHERR